MIFHLFYKLFLLYLNILIRIQHICAYVHNIYLYYIYRFQYTLCRVYFKSVTKTNQCQTTFSNPCFVYLGRLKLSKAQKNLTLLNILLNNCGITVQEQCNKQEMCDNASKYKNQSFFDIYNICSPKIFKKDYSISPLRQTVRHFFGFKSPVYIVTNPHTNSLLTPKNTFFSSTPADLLPIYPT